MKIYDKDWNQIEEVDYNLGNTEERHRKVVHKWIIDSPELSHQEVIREYHNGGKDIETVIDKAEIGHWETYLEDGTKIEFDYDFPEGFPHDDVYELQSYLYYQDYTDEEVARKKAEKELLLTEQANREAEQQYLKTAESRTENLESINLDHDEAIISLNDAITQIQLNTDEAIVSMYELINGGLNE